jgi:hypothetical protein
MVSQNPFKIAMAILQITMSTMLGWIRWRMGTQKMDHWVPSTDWMIVEMLVIPRLELSILSSRSELTCRRPLQLFG